MVYFRPVNKRIYLASNNSHKAAEISTILAAQQCGFEVTSALEVGGMPEVEETGSTFLENARIKAQALAAQVDEGIVLADDSGLEVDHLSGAPGVHTARYAGPGATDEANNAKLLDALGDQPFEQRAARFVCCLVLLWKHADGRIEEENFEHRLEGHIAHELRGETGFGYDPLFIPTSYQNTLAELGPQVKNAISHRAQATLALADWLRR